jgi:hypothetical protein
LLAADERSLCVVGHDLDIAPPADLSRAADVVGMEMGEHELGVLALVVAVLFSALANGDLGDFGDGPRRSRRDRK